MGNTCHLCDNSTPKQDITRHLALKQDITSCLTPKTRPSPASSIIQDLEKEILSHRLSSLDTDIISLIPDASLLKYQAITKKIGLNALLLSAPKYFTAEFKSHYHSNHPHHITTGISNPSNPKNFIFNVFIKENIIPSKNNKRIHESFHNFSIDFHPFEYLLGSLYLDYSIRKKFDSSVESHEVLYYYEENQILYYFHRCTTKKILVMKGKELVFATAVKKLEDGSFLEVNMSYDEEDRPVSGQFDRMELFESATLFRKMEEGMWEVENYQLLDPRTGIGLKTLRFFMGSYYKKLYMNIFSTLKVSMEDGRANWRERMEGIDFEKLF